MRLLLVRDTLLDGVTLGRLSVVGDGAIPIWQTLEDTDRRLEEDPSAKIRGSTAIPRGVYSLTLAYSPRFARVTPRLLDVPGYSGVLIHAGNTASDTAGCILVGEERSDSTVLRSRAAMSRLMSVLDAAFSRDEAVEIEVR